MKRLLVLLLLLGAPAFSATPGLAQYFSSAANDPNAVPGKAFSFFTHEAVGAGNCIVLFVGYNGVATATVADTNGNTWPAATRSATDGTTATLRVFVLPNANAGVTKITVTLGADSTGFEYSYSEWYNVPTSSPVDASSANNATSSTPNIDGGSLATLTDGDLIITHLYGNGGPGGAGQGTSVTPGAGFALLHADFSWQNQGGLPHAAQYKIETTHGTNTYGLTFNLTGGGAIGYLGINLALKNASAGTVPAATIRINSIAGRTDAAYALSSNWVMPFPCSGNLLALRISTPSNFTGGVTDSKGNTWVRATNGTTGPGWWYAKGAACDSTNIVTIHTMDSQSNASFDLLDISGADSTSPLDGVQEIGATTDTNDATMTNFPTITPSSFGLTLANLQNGEGPSSGLAAGAPAGAVFDFVYYTVTTPPNDSCALPFPGETDGDRIDNADGMAHAYNLSDLSTQNWNWTEANGGCTHSTSSSAIHFKAAAGGIAHLPQAAILLVLPNLPPPAITLGPAQLNMVRALVPFSAVDLAVTFDIAAEWLTPQTVLVCQSGANAPFDVVVLEQRVSAATLHAIRAMQTNDAATVQCIGGNPQ